MKWFLVFVTLLAAKVLAVEPKVPRSLTLHADAIAEVSLHEKVTTVLQFSEKVTMVTGVGLTDGSTDGVVQCEHPKDSRNVILRGLGKEGRVLMQVMMGDQVYALLLTRSEEPDSVVRLSALSPEAEVAAAKETGLLVSEERSAEILRLAAERFGGTMVEGIDARRVHNLWRGENVEILAESVARVAKDDVIVLKGSLKNAGTESLDLGSLSASLLVGEARLVPATKFQPNVTRLEPGARAEYFLLVAGDGYGARANLSLKNRFDLILTPPKKE